MTEQIGKIIDAEDILARARDLIECASCAAAHVWGKEADQVSTALEVADEKIDAAIALLVEYRNASGFGPGAVKGGELEAACERLRTTNTRSSSAERRQAGQLAVPDTLAVSSKCHTSLTRSPSQG